MNLADVLRNARLVKGWSGKELARRAQVDPSVITKIEKGQQVGRADSIARLGIALDLPSDAVQRLLAGEDVVITASADRTPEEIAAELAAALRRDRERREAEAQAREAEARVAREEADLRARGLVGDVYRVPMAEQSVSAGYGSTLEAEMGQLLGNAPRVADRISVRVVGDCMEPHIPQGAIVLVDKTSQPEPGDAVLVSHDGEWLCKWYEVDDDWREGFPPGVWLTANQHREPIRPNGHTFIIGVVVDVQSGKPKRNG